jgi:hypothetical protein
MWSIDIQALMRVYTIGDAGAELIPGCVGETVDQRNRTATGK